MQEYVSSTCGWRSAPESASALCGAALAYLVICALLAPLPPAQQGDERRALLRGVGSARELVLARPHNLARADDALRHFCDLVQMLYSPRPSTVHLLRAMFAHVELHPEDLAPLHAITRTACIAAHTHLRRIEDPRAVPSDLLQDVVEQVGRAFSNSMLEIQEVFMKSMWGPSPWAAQDKEDNFSCGGVIYKPVEST